MVRASARRTEQVVDDIGETAERANERASESTRKTGEETEKTEKKFKDYAEELAEVNKLLEKDSKNTTLLAQKKELLKKAVDDTADKFDDLCSRQEEINRAYSNGEIPDEEYRAFQRQIIATEQELDEYRRALAEVGEESVEVAEQTESKLGSAFGAVATGAAAAVTAVAGAAVGIGTAAVSSSDSLEKAAKKIISATGASADSLEDMEQVISDIYSDNFGEDFDDIANSVAKIKQNLGDMDNVRLVNVTESAYALLDVFEMGVDESSRAARAMEQNFNISAEKAYDYIAAGAQNGLDYSGELLDSISEYSVQFAKMGLSADDMFNIFAAGAESGAWNLDKIGDAVKEMSIRVIDGSDSTREGFEKAGLAADEMAAKFGEGGEAAREAFTETLQALISIDDPLERDAAGVAILGTMWEDLGADAVAALAGITDSAYDTADAMESIKDINYSSLSDALEGLKRQVEMLIEPLGDTLIEPVSQVIDELSKVADGAIPQMVESITPVIDGLIPLIAPLMELIASVLPDLVSMLAPIITLFGELVKTILPPLSEFISGELIPVIAEFVTELSEMLMPIITVLISELLPPILDIVSALLPLMSTATEIVRAVLPLISSLIAPLTALLSRGIVPIVEQLVLLINDILIPLIPLIEKTAYSLSDVLGSAVTLVTTIVEGVANAFENLRRTLGGIIDFIVGVFTGDWEKAWGGICDVFGGMWEQMKNSAELTINAIIDMINLFIEYFNHMFSSLDVELETLSHIELTENGAKATGGGGQGRRRNGSASYDPTEHYKQKDLEAKGRAETAAAENAAARAAESNSLPYVSAGNTYSPGNYSGGYSSSGSGGNFVSITSYIPTVWDSDQTAELKSLIGADMVGNSAAAHSIDALTSGGISPASAAESGETGLADVVNAITRLQRKVESIDATVNVVLKADDLAIGKASVRDINSMYKQSGKSPFDFD